ncbi:hypothetical protein [Ammoniphilus sp. 3BR4]|uniref:hypothetical protein n=1 Tax=Ammoniphilus sp. 3BR4 TaxID=3158265 RepID=UPI0034678EC0
MDIRALEINEAMKQAAVLIPEEEFNSDYVIPKPFDVRVAPQVVLAFANAALEIGIAQNEFC